MYQVHYFFNYIMIFLFGLSSLICGSPNKANVTMIAHTGLCEAHLENTEEAFLGAIENGSDGLETDLRFTKDGQLVCWHDGDVEFVDGTRVKIGEATLEELQAQPIKNFTCDEESYICSFKHYLEICREHGMLCFLDLKDDFSDINRVKQLFDTVDEFYDRSMVIPQSSSYEDIIPIRELFPEQKIMLCYGRIQFEEGLDYERCFEYGFDIDADVTFMNKKILKEFHSRGLEVGIFTCNSKLELNYGFAIGVDYIESDVFGR